MDLKLRQLERAGFTDPEAQSKYIAEMQRLGFHTITETVYQCPLNGFPGRAARGTWTLEEFNLDFSNILAKLGNPGNYYRFAFYFQGNCSCYSLTSDNDHYCDSDVTINFIVCGDRLETEKEMSKRMAQEQRAEEDKKRYMKNEEKRRKEARQQVENKEKEIYERLKRKFESEDKKERLLASLGPEAEKKLRSYKASYLNSWFNRKSKKLDGKTPLQIFDEEDIEKLRLYILN